MTIGAAVALHANRAHVGKQHHGALPNVAIQSRGGKLCPGNGVGLLQNVDALLSHLADDADAKPRPGEWLAPHDLSWQAELKAYGPHLVLEQRAKGFYQVKLEVVRQAADVVMALDGCGAFAAS